MTQAAPAPALASASAPAPSPSLTPTKPPFNPLKYAKAAVDVESRADGSRVLRCPHPLRDYPRCNAQWLVQHAQAHPTRVFLAERRDGAWFEVNYEDALAAARRIGTALLERGLNVEKPVAILSDNSVEHALLSLGCYYAGVPFAPISQAYSLMSKDHAKLKAVIDLLTPGLVYVSDEARFAGALAAVREVVPNVEVLASKCATESSATSFSAFAATAPKPLVDAAFAAITGNTIAKFLFTSGSTGDPKGVINTQRMICSNQASYHTMWPFLSEEPLVLVDWLPWNHTFGGNSNFNMVLSQGGSLYIDEGKPAPGLIEKTAANLRDVSPTMILNVPRGYDMLLPLLESDAVLRKSFFRRLQLIFYAGAALPPSLWARLEELSVAETGRRVRMVSSWGSTETAPMASIVHYDIERAGVIGNPAAGTELKLIPAGLSDGRPKYEIRVRGPNVTPGYWKREDLTQAAFDEEGFYIIGDAVRMADEADAAKGIEFAGRVSEEFKLTSGTWVATGNLRVKAIAALAPLVQDLVVTGHDRDHIGFLLFPNVPALRALARDLPQDAHPSTVFKALPVRDAIVRGLQALMADGGGSSTYAKVAMLLEEPPNIDAGEITDKGYINQRAVLARRAALVEALYAQPFSSELIRI